MAGMQRFPLVLSASLASTIGGVPFNTLPVVLGTLGGTLGLSATALGDLAGTLFAGYFVGTLLALVFIDRLDWRWVTGAAAVGTAVAYAFSGVAQGVALSGALALLGLFAALMTALGLRVLAQLPNKEQAFGFRQSTELWLTAAVLFALPPLAISALASLGQLQMDAPNAAHCVDLYGYRMQLRARKMANARTPRSDRTCRLGGHPSCERSTAL